VDLGVMVPQGYLQEYHGWTPERALARSVEIAKRAEELGVGSLWAVDHFQTNPDPRDELTFESFTLLTALVCQTHRIRLGHLVACTGYRNPALTAKMVSTMDVISGGRMILGIGAGWKEDEWRGYGYGFPSLHDRLAALEDHLAIIALMLAPGRATYTGQYASVADAINEPRGLQQPRVPILVGGNGPNVTWRLAARYADELNLDGLSPSQVRDALPVIRSRCEEIGRDPSTLRLSVQIWSDQMGAEGSPRVDLLGAYAEIGLTSVMGFPPQAVDDREALDRLTADARTAGLTLASP
jgi:F420-dependent oxidoreductase-like protein